MDRDERRDLKDIRKCGLAFTYREKVSGENYYFPGYFLNFTATPYLQNGGGLLAGFLTLA